VEAFGIRVLHQALATFSKESLKNYRNLVYDGIFGLGKPSQLLHEKSREEASFGDKQPSSFLANAHINSFSICFERNGDGDFYIDGDPDLFFHKVPTDSDFHWSISLNGIRLVPRNRSALVSNPSEKLEKDSPQPIQPPSTHIIPVDPAKTKRINETNALKSICNATNSSGKRLHCAAIVDSGTTLVIGPKRQVDAMFSDLCNNLKECDGSTVTERSKNFLAALLSCPKDLHMLPNIEFMFGNKSMVLSPINYIMVAKASDLSKDNEYSRFFEHDLKSGKSGKKFSRILSRIRTACIPVFTKETFKISNSREA